MQQRPSSTDTTQREPVAERASHQTAAIFDVVLVLGVVAGVVAAGWRWLRGKESSTDDRRAARARTYAKSSCLFTLLSFPVTGFTGGGSPATTLAGLLCAAVLLSVALALAIYALTKIRAYGRSGLLIPALATITIQVLCIVLATWQMLEP